MNHYIIARKDKRTKQVEFLRVLDCKRHDWSTTQNNSTIFNSNQMRKKINALQTYGKKDCIYYPNYVYQQGSIFKDEEINNQNT